MKKQTKKEVKGKKRGSWWTICVGNYGNFELHGSEETAEEMRVHKARWEHSPTIKLPGRWADKLRGKSWNDIYQLSRSLNATKQGEKHEHAST